MSNDNQGLSTNEKPIPDNEQSGSTPSSDTPDQVSLNCADQQSPNLSATDSQPKSFSLKQNLRNIINRFENCTMHRNERCDCQIASSEPPSQNTVINPDDPHSKPSSINSDSSTDSAVSVENIQKLITDLAYQDVKEEIIKREDTNFISKFFFRKKKQDTIQSIGHSTIVNNNNNENDKVLQENSKSNNQVWHTPLTDGKSISLDSSECTEDSLYRPRSVRRLDFCSGKYFDPKIHGKDEEEFYQIRFKSIIRRCLPDNYNFANVPRTPTRAQRHYNGSQKYRLSCSQNNCGHCYCLKMYILISLLAGIFLYLFDPCFQMSPNKPTDAVIATTTVDPSNLVSSNNTALSDDDDEQTDQKSWHKSDIIDPKFQNKNFILIDSEPQPEPTPKNFTETNPSSNKNSTVNNAEFCDFKLAYIIMMAIGVLVYFSMMCLYTCDVILFFYYFSWHLLEAILFAAYSFLLSILTMIAFIIGQHNIATTIVLISCMFGYILAWVAYRYHNEGVIPSIIISNDPDGNLLTKILSRKLFRKRTLNQ